MSIAQEQPPAFEQTPELLEEQLLAIDKTFTDAYIPTLAELGNAVIVAKGIHEINPDEFCDANGTPIERELAKRTQAKANPNNWILDESHQNTAEAVLSTSDVDSLSPANLQDFRNFLAAKNPDGAADEASIFDAYKQHLTDRVSLSQALASLKADEEQDIAQQAQSDTAASATQKQTPMQAYTSEVSDIINVAKNGAAQRSNGKFMSKHEAKQIANFQDQIREGVTAREQTYKTMQQRKELMVNMYGQEEYDRRFANNPKADPDAWLSQQQNAGPQVAKQAKSKTAEIQEATTPDSPAIDETPAAPSAESVIPVPADVDEAIWNSMPQAAKLIWGRLKDPQKDDLKSAYAPETEKTVDTAPVQEDDTAPAPEVTAPLTRKQRLGRIFNKAQAKLRLAKMDTVDYFSDSEKGKRRKIVAGVIGAVGVLGAYGAVRYGMNGGGASHDAVQNGVAKARTHHTLNDITAKPQGTAAAHAAKFQQVELKPGTGDSLWREEARHHHGASQPELLRRVKEDLKVNGLTMKKAEDISGKYKITR